MSVELCASMLQIGKQQHCLVEPIKCQTSACLSVNPRSQVNAVQRLCLLHAQTNGTPSSPSSNSALSMPPSSTGSTLTFLRCGTNSSSSSSSPDAALDSA